MLNLVLVVINSDLPHFERLILHVILKEIAFVYEKRGNKAMLIVERYDTV
jgi:Tfp pilus assembly ATPase PilU